MVLRSRAQGAPLLLTECFLYTYLADFLKPNLTKFAVIWVKRLQKEGFLTARISKITVTKENETWKRKSEEKERWRREKRNGCTLSFYNNYFGDSFWPKNKNCYKLYKRKIKEVHQLIPPPPPPSNTHHTNWHKRTKFVFEQIQSVKFPQAVQCNATNKSGQWVSGWFWQSARSVSSVREYISLGLIFARLYGINA